MEQIALHTLYGLIIGFGLFIVWQASKDFVFEVICLFKKFFVKPKPVKPFKRKFRHGTVLGNLIRQVVEEMD